MDGRRRRNHTARSAFVVLVTATLAASCAGGPDEVIQDVAPVSTTAPAAPTTAATEESDVTEEPDVTEPPSSITPAQTEPEAVATPVPPPPSDPATTIPDDAAVMPDEDSSNSEQPSATCRRISDFDGGGDGGGRGAGGDGWVIVNDGVMGGRSNGAVEISDSVMSFTGGVVTAGGGFTSVRYRLVGGEMADSTSLRLRVRSDQRVYGITLEDRAEAGQRSVSHRADFDISGSPDSAGWVEVTLDYTELTASVFGQAVDAPPFDPDSAREIGIIIADGVDGPFALDVDWIDVCR